MRLYHDSGDLQLVVEMVPRSHCRHRCREMAQWNLATRSWRTTEGAPSCVLTGRKSGSLFLQPESFIKGCASAEGTPDTWTTPGSPKHDRLSEALAEIHPDAQQKARTRQLWLCPEHTGGGWMLGAAAASTRSKAAGTAAPREGMSMEDDERRRAVFGHVRRCGPQEPPLHRSITANSKSTRAGNRR